MTSQLRRSVIVLAALAFAPLGSCALGQSYGMFKEPLPMIQRSVLPVDTEGRLGGVGYDPASQCMYFTGVRAGVLHVLDGPGMNTLQTIKDLPEPNNVCVAADLKKLVLTCGDGTVKIYTIAADGKLTEDKSFSVPGEADAVRYDPNQKRAYVGHGKFVSAVDMVTGTKVGKGVELPGPVKGVAVAPNGSKVFANVASQGKVVVIDANQWAIEKTFTLKDAQGNYPLTTDDTGNLLFVACRNPAALLILDAKDGTEKQRLAIGNDDATDCWYDARGKRVYISAGNGNGTVSMIWNKPSAPRVEAPTTPSPRLAEVNAAIAAKEAELAALRKERDDLNAPKPTGDMAAAGWVVEHNVDTAPGARTSVLIPERGRYIVTAPKLTYPPFVFIYLTPGPNEHHDPNPNQGH